MWWGHSEALDLIDEIPNTWQSYDQGDTNEQVYNILLVGQTDGRHMLKTIAQKYRHNENIKLNFYVYEEFIETIGRELLFLTLALEPPANLGIAEKTLFFMELYGNAFLRPATKNYLKKVSQRLINMVVDRDYQKLILPSVSLDELTYKFKDNLEAVFKYWIDCQCDIARSWETRLRNDLGVRYDNREGVFDWDYHMRYRCLGADVLKINEYKRFRESGISFYLYDTSPCLTNSTLAMGISERISTKSGFSCLGDTISGPYPCYGFKCEDSDMFKKVNGQLPKTATDLTERNIMRMLYEIENNKCFVALPEDDENCIPVVLADALCEIKKTSEINEESQATHKCYSTKYDMYKSLETNNCSVIFLGRPLQKIFTKPQYKHFFDMIYMSRVPLFHNFDSNALNIMKSKCQIIIETPKFELFRKEQLEEFKTKLLDLMSTWQFELLNGYDTQNDEFVRFLKC
ncbi:hypothetical protein RUM44_006807 [Polyplax serrata]|uniref:Dynein assembly factor 3, axonemal n=1 Tax=Polyplax serrata TaxID=468196 RepID=A0ABR1AKU0_POLSC